MYVNSFNQDNMGASIAGLTQGDYRQDGKMELIVASTDGEGRTKF